MDLEPDKQQPGRILLRVEDAIEEDVLLNAGDADAPLMREVRSGLTDDDTYPKHVSIPLGEIRWLRQRVVAGEITANSMSDPAKNKAAHDIARVINRYVDGGPLR